VLLARATGTPLDRLLAERVLDPLGMSDTGFVARDLARFGPQWLPGAHGPTVYDPTGGQWSTPPAFPDAAAGLVSTVADLHAFAQALRGGGPAQVVPEREFAAMVAPYDGGPGWGLGIGVITVHQSDGRHAGTYGWDGGLGSSWWTDPVTDTIAIVLTTDAWSSPEPTAVFVDFWRAAFS
jgi:CubicO group peptidase (beta-lactamase class C family)